MALMNNQSTPSPKEGPRKPRALTYTEMMNGGRQQMDEAEHNREVELQRRTEELETKVEHLGKSLEE